MRDAKNYFPPRSFCDKVARILPTDRGRVLTEEGDNEKPTSPQSGSRGERQAHSNLRQQQKRRNGPELIKRQHEWEEPPECPA